MQRLARGKLATGKIIRGTRPLLRLLLRRPTPELRALRAEPIGELRPRLSSWVEQMTIEHRGGKVLGKPTSATRKLFARPTSPDRLDEAFDELVDLVVASGRWAPHRVYSVARPVEGESRRATFEPAPRRAADLLWPPPYLPELTLTGNGWGNEPHLIVVRLSLRCPG